MNPLRNIAIQLNESPDDILQPSWGFNSISANYIANNLDAIVNLYGKLFRKKKLHYESGLVLYIYAHPSYRLFELIRKEPLLRECRGLILSPLGVRSRPFPVIPTITWDNALLALQSNNTATVKINGQMITGLIIKGKPICITKSGNNILPLIKREEIYQLIYDSDTLGLTPIFEITDEDRPIVFREPTSSYLVGLRSRLTGRLAMAADLIELSNYYDLSSLTLVNYSDVDELQDKIEGLVFNDGVTILRTKTPVFHQLQKITAMIRYDKVGDLKELLKDVSKDVLHVNLTTSELENLKRRNLI